jgi:hypothetical protein
VRRSAAPSLAPRSPQRPPRPEPAPTPPRPELAARAHDLHGHVGGGQMRQRHGHGRPQETVRRLETIVGLLPAQSNKIVSGCELSVAVVKISGRKERCI